MLNLFHFRKLIAGLILVVLLHSNPKEHMMKRSRIQYVAEDNRYIIDMYFKLEMKYLLDKIAYAHSQGSFDTLSVEAA